MFLHSKKRVFRENVIVRTYPLTPPMFFLRNIMHRSQPSVLLHNSQQTLNLTYPYALYSNSLIIGEYRKTLDLRKESLFVYYSVPLVYLFLRFENCDWIEKLPQWESYSNPMYNNCNIFSLNYLIHCSQEKVQYHFPIF